MELLIIVSILILTILIDYFWIDMERKRWGWLKSSSKRTKIIFFSIFIVISIVIYLGITIDTF
jgi:hypothetical protein